MFKKLLIICGMLSTPMYAFATPDTYSVEDYLTPTPMKTECATAIYNKALADNANMITSPLDASSNEIDTWAHFAFSQPEVIAAVLECPELSALDDEDTIIFEPVSYTFPNGRNIEINYETTKNILQQRLLLATKPDLTSSEINPDLIEDVEKGNIWINVDPAWYAIVVAEHGSLDEFVGPGKKNVLAVNYIEKNIDKFYPKDHYKDVFHADCTSRSAIAGDTDMINRAATITVGGPPPHSKKAEPQTEEEKEQAKIAKNNDYYVMGEANLQWIAALEVVADVVLTVVTWGGAAAAKGAIQGLRMTRALAKSQKAIKTLRTSKNVTKWVKTSKTVKDVDKAIKTVDNIEDSYKVISRLDNSATQTVQSLTRKRDLLKARNAKSRTIKEVEKELEIAKKQAQTSKSSLETAEKLRAAEQKLKEGSLSPDEVKTLEKEVADLKSTYSSQLKELDGLHAKELKELESSKDVKTYKQVEDARREVAHSAYLLRQGKIALQADRGILPVRIAKSWRKLNKGIKAAKKSDKAVKAIRAGTSGFSARLNDWLFHSTMKNLSTIATVPAALQTLKTFVNVIADTYDYTDISTSEFTNDIDMKPYLLLGADDIENYENVVNYGMWLFWSGSSTSAADDDAAFLQAMSFAEKFHQDLVEVQDEYNVMACDVDIYVVRPIIRNPNTKNAELYYLFMNDKPWTTHYYNEPNDGSEPALIAKRADDTQQYGITENDTEYQTYSDADPVTLSSSLPTADGGISRTSKGIGTYIEPKYDGSRVGQPCTKPSASGGTFTDNILTSGRYASISPAFEKAMITKFRTEGGCGEHPSDPAGYTCYGVSSKYFPQVKQPGFSRKDAEDIAYNSFFKKYNLDKLPDAISGDVFMALWGTGSKRRSIGLLQELLGIEITNVVDEQTINAAKNYTGPDLRTRFLDRREESFRRGKKEFRQGWLNGLELYRANGCHTIIQDNAS